MKEGTTDFDVRGLREIRAECIICAMEDLERAYTKLPKLWTEWRSAKANYAKRKKNANLSGIRKAQKDLNEAKELWSKVMRKYSQKAYAARKSGNHPEIIEEYERLKAENQSVIDGLKGKLEQEQEKGRNDKYRWAKAKYQGASFKLNRYKGIIEECEEFFLSGRTLLFTDISGDVILDSVRKKVDYGKVEKVLVWMSRNDITK